MLDGSLVDMLGQGDSFSPFLQLSLSTQAEPEGRLYQAGEGPRGLLNFLPPKSHLWGVELLFLEGRVVTQATEGGSLQGLLSRP